MTTLAQGQKDNKPAVLAGFILLLAIAAFFALATDRATLSSTIALVVQGICSPLPLANYIKQQDPLRYPSKYHWEIDNQIPGCPCAPKSLRLHSGPGFRAERRIGCLSQRRASTREDSQVSD
jgi:hypothetical protein